MRTRKLAAVLTMALVLEAAVSVTAVGAKGGGGGGGAAGACGGGGSGGSGGGPGGGGGPAGGGGGASGGPGASSGGGGASSGSGGPSGSALIAITGAGRRPTQPRRYVRGTGSLSDGSAASRESRGLLALSPAQERTWDAFHRCAPSGAVLDQLRVDGSFTFRTESVADTQTIRRCMGRAGYRFNA